MIQYPHSNVDFMNFQLRKIFIFYNGTSNCREFIVVHIWVDSGIFSLQISIVLDFLEGQNIAI